MRELYYRLLSDMKRVGLPTSFTLELKPYSKTYYGRYDPNTDKIVVYVYEDKSCTKMQSYEDILLTCIHEAIHSIQWHNPSFVRRKGVMHDAEFHSMYNMYSDRAKSILLLKELNHDSIFEACRRSHFEVPCRHFP